AAPAPALASASAASAATRAFQRRRTCRSWSRMRRTAVGPSDRAMNRPPTIGRARSPVNAGGAPLSGRAAPAYDPGMATAPVRAHARVARETLREERNAQAPWWYNPWVHLAIPSLVGATAIVTAVVLLRNPGPGDVLFVLVVLALTNANEWR